MNTKQLTAIPLPSLMAVMIEEEDGSLTVKGQSSHTLPDEFFHRISDKDAQLILDTFRYDVKGNPHTPAEFWQPNNEPVEQTANLALTFSAVLLSWLTPDERAEMNAKNKTDEYRAVGCCASHDYVDSNEAMNEAMTTVLGRSFEFNGQDLNLLAKAWEMAIQNDFYNTITDDETLAMMISNDFLLMVLALKSDPYLTGHAEWPEIVADALNHDSRKLAKHIAAMQGDAYLSKSKYWPLLEKRANNIVKR